MKNTLKATLSIYTALALITSCTNNIPNNSNYKSDTLTNSTNLVSKYAIRGKTDFSDKLKKTPFSTKSTIGQVGDRATVSLLFSPDPGEATPNKTIATGLTNASGDFSIIPTPDFIPVNNKVYILEAQKRVGAITGPAGVYIITIRTYVKWNGTGWDSITDPPIMINSKTTALTIIDNYDTNIIPSETIGTIIGGNPTDIGSPVKVSATTISDLTVLVDNTLTQDVDPVRNISFANNNYFINKEANHAATAVLNSSISCPGCNLKYADLSNKDFTDLDFNLADFTGANLSNSILRGANLVDANFSNAIVVDTNLTGAFIKNAQYSIYPGYDICGNDSISLCNKGFVVNTYTTGQQRNVSVAADNAGNFIIVWETINSAAGADPNIYDVFAQRFDYHGELVGSEFRVSADTAHQKTNADVEMDATGNFVITWTNKGKDDESDITGSLGIYAKMFDNNGDVKIPDGCASISGCDPATGEFLVNSYITGTQDHSSVDMNASGNFVITWDSNNTLGTQDGSNEGVYARRYNSSGVPQIPTTCNSPDCDSVSGEFHVSTYTTFAQKTPQVAMDINGNYVIVWQSNQDPPPSAQPGDPYISTYGIYGQRYNSNGVGQVPTGCGTTIPVCDAITGEFRVNSYTSFTQFNPYVSINDSGTFLVTWQTDLKNVTGPNLNATNGVYGHRYDSSGALQTPTTCGSTLNHCSNSTEKLFSKNYSSDTSRVPRDPVTVLHNNGKVALIYAEKDQSFEGNVNMYIKELNSTSDFIGTGSQTFNSGFQLQLNDDATFGEQIQPAVAMDAGGNLIIVWEDHPGNSNLTDIVARRYRTNF